MGGYGSGRWGRRLGARLLTTQCLSVDVRLLAREGALVPGATFTLEYRQGRALRGTVTPGMVTMGSVRIRLAWTPCRFGGHRPWWLCPRCGRRCAILYAAFGTLACRICLNLAYPTERMGPMERADARALAARRRLGIEDLSAPLPRRCPPGMPKWVFRRLLASARRADARRHDAWYAELRRALRRRVWLQRLVFAPEEAP